VTSRWFGLQFTPPSATFFELEHVEDSIEAGTERDEEEDLFQTEKSVVHRSGVTSR
jgi:hypothetical protein